MTNQTTLINDNDQFGSKLMTWEEMLAIFPADYKKNTESGLIWWSAYHEASELHDCNTIKDWARLILDGMPPCTRESALNLVQQLVQSWMEDEDYTLAEAKKKALDIIREFFQIPLDDD